MKKEAGNRVHISFQINFTSGNKKIILITTFVFFRYAIVIASIIVYVNYPVKTRSYNV